MIDQRGRQSPRTARPWADGAAVAGLMLAAALPTLASAWRAGTGWLPVGDAAAIALRASDVFSTNTPLVGMPTTLSDSVGQPVHHPGPMEFWVIAVFQAVLGHPAAPMVAIVAVNIASIVAVVICARWIAGRVGAAAVASWLAISSWSLRGDILIEPYNPYAAHLPLAAYLAAVVAACSGRLWALPVAVVSGSYAAQAHVSLLAPVGAVAVAATITTMASEGGVRSVVGRSRKAMRDHRSPLMVAVVAAVVCWSPVLIDLVAGNRNLWRLAMAGGADGEALGFERAWHVLARAITSPGWLTEDRSAFDVVRPVGGFTHLLAVAVLAATVAAVVRSWKRTPALAVALLVALAALAAGTVAAAQIPTGVFNLFALPNYLWLWPVTGLLWLSLLAAVAVEVTERSEGRQFSWAPAVPVAIAVIAGLVGAINPPVRTSTTAEHGPPTASLSEQLGVVLDPDSIYLVEIHPFIERAAVGMGLLVELERQGIQVVIPPEHGRMFGEHRVHRGQPIAGHLVVAQDPSLPDPPSGNAELVALFIPRQQDLATLRAAQRDLAEAISSGGGLITGFEQHDHTDDEVWDLLETRALLGLWDFGLIVSPEIDPGLIARYRNATNAAVLEVGVYLVPSPPG